MQANGTRYSRVPKASKVQHGFTPGYSRESQVVGVCQDIADCWTRESGQTDDNGLFRDFRLVPHDRLLTEIEATGVDLRVVVWVKEFLLGRSQRVRVDGQLSEEVRVTSGGSQGSVLGPLMYLAYVNDIWRNIESNIRLFADGCVICRKIKDSSDIDKLQTDLNRLGEWAVESEMNLNPGKSKAVSFTKARVKERIRY